jgi:hypothetical protein
MTAIANKLSIAGLAIAGSLGVGATGASAQAVYVDPLCSALRCGSGPSCRVRRADACRCAATDRARARPGGPSRLCTRPDVFGATSTLLGIRLRGRCCCKSRLVSPITQEVPPSKRAISLSGLLRDCPVGARWAGRSRIRGLAA